MVGVRNAGLDGWVPVEPFPGASGCSDVGISREVDDVLHDVFVDGW